MPDSASTQAAVLVFFAAGALAIYGGQIRRLIRDGGKVRSDDLGFPELLMSIVFAGFFTLLTVSAMSRHDPQVSEAKIDYRDWHPDQYHSDEHQPSDHSHEHQPPEAKIDSVLPNSLVFIAFTVGIAGFFQYRGFRLRHIFGIDQVSILPALGWACAYILAAFPIAAGANALTMIALQGHFEPQPLVDLFHKVARQHDYGAISIILVSAVFIQPVCEEFLFRGFFYGVWKRYLGGFGAALLASLLFAAFHTSLAAFAGLFVLAVCLNIAYERTGSLLVPMVMHGLFNLTSLLFIYWQAQSGAAH